MSFKRSDLAHIGLPSNPLASVSVEPVTAAAQPPESIRIRRRVVVRVLAAVIVLLIVLSLAGQVSRHFLGYGHVFGLVELFNVDAEQNLPTWYSSLALLFSASLLAVIAWQAHVARERFARHWAFLALAFLYLSTDEAALIHERSVEPLQRLTGGMPLGMWAPTWVIPALAAIVIVAALYLRFFFSLPPRERLQFIVAAVLFVGGAVGLEMAAAAVVFSEGYDPAFQARLDFIILAHTEEAMEMAGVLVFIDALLRRLGSGRPLRITFVPT